MISTNESLDLGPRVLLRWTHGPGAMIVLNGEEYLTVKEAARLLGVKPATLYAYVSRGVLRSYRQGIKRERLYRRAEIEALLRMAPSPAPEIPLAESWIRD